MKAAWKTIDSAPKGDAVWILIASPNGVNEACFYDDMWLDRYGRYEDPWDGNSYQPTHWQPLPAPPETPA